jgi:hypothetical protein
MKITADATILLHLVYEKYEMHPHYGMLAI